MNPGSLRTNKCIRIYCMLAFMASMLIACKPSTPPAAEGTGDLAGFELTDIPGSNTRHAVRKDGNGQLVYEGFVTDGKKSGQWVEYNSEGEVVLIENFINGLQEGLALKLVNRGQIELKSRYHQGVLHGNWTQFKFGKVIEERTYLMGKLDGIVRTFDDRTWKVKQEVQYKNGLQNGYFRYYDEEGNVTLEYEYKNGEKVSGGIVKK